MNDRNGIKSRRIKYILYACCFLFSGCTSVSDPLEKALRLSGTNRGELEKVLRHYEQDPADRLKYKAAVFLIRHMPGHYSYEDVSFRNYRKRVDSLYPAMSEALKKVVYSVPFKDRKIQYSEQVEDIQRLGADFLIGHIEEAFKKWRNSPWLKELSFEDFCEYLLPYRLYEEPVGGEFFSGRNYWEELLDLFDRYPALTVSQENIQQIISDLFRSDDVYRPRLLLPFLARYTFDCLDDCFYGVNRYREAGVPATVDYIPCWPSRNGSHSWVVVVNNAYPHRIFTNVTVPAAAKVYRRTYSHQPIPQIEKGKQEMIPAFFRIPFYKDVTTEYIKTTDITLKPEIKGKEKPEYVWLTVFNEQQWHPVAWAPLKKGRAVFKKMGCGYVYLPVCYQGQRQVNTGYPFLVSPGGKVSELIPDPTEKVRLRLTRKYPMTYHKLQWGRDLPGACLEASNDPLFAEKDTLHIIRTLHPDLNMTFVPLDTRKAYRYWRISKPGRMLNIGELIFREPSGRQIQGRIIAARKNDFDTLAFDGDPLTYGRALSWVGMDMGKPVTLGCIGYMPHTDDNGIRPGDEYELFYYGNQGWESLGRQIAGKDHLEYENVPGKALYWLHNHSGGKEERIFIREQGKVVFY